MRRRITIEVEVSCSEQVDDEQLERLLSYEFGVGSISCEEYDKIVESVDYRVVSCIVE